MNTETSLLSSVRLSVSPAEEAVRVNLARAILDSIRQQVEQAMRGTCSALAKPAKPLGSPEPRLCHIGGKH